jgi:ABC-type proline/glycine betaine transport system permease subunit
MAVFGIFNLDFHYLFKFHKFNQVCLSLSFKGVHVLALKYVEAFTPFVLMLIISLCAYLHSKDCKPLVWAWKVVLKIITTCTCYKKPTKNLSQCLCSAYIAFSILAYSKILFVSLNFLIPNKIYEMNGVTVTEHWSLYFESLTPPLSILEESISRM